MTRFSDCDPFGHLNNARYIDYFINAREDHLRRIARPGVDLRRAPLKKAIGETASGCSDVEANSAFRQNRERVETSFKLDATAADISERLTNLNRGAGINRLARL